jgi:phosphoribosyl-ATP pyrophosphohydrolase
MKTQSEYLDIDHLRNFEVDPAYFGLGFIQLKVDLHNRVHFYHNDLPILSDNPHNHRYSFTSYILQGTLEQTTFQWDYAATGEFLTQLVNCKAGSNLIASQQSGQITQTLYSSYATGSRYQIEADTLHTVSGIDNAVTHLIRGDTEKEYAAVIVQKGDEPVCPFSEPLTTKRCWELIEDMLPKKKKKKNKKHGYHIMDIPKGTIGEPSKIVEEALEIMDAHQQGVRIMAATEMGDLYGALDRYREKHHADLTMEDIHAMYMVTRRAFDSGRRT